MRLFVFLCLVFTMSEAAMFGLKFADPRFHRVVKQRYNRKSCHQRFTQMLRNLSAGIGDGMLSDNFNDLGLSQKD
ncbi:Oidioi.mRNA.OKI2018_I69.PAR.g9303.t1.cds [Oikopleura dioica]|uniref:Oidioi.mRNA.OKI2018_I69.PAR.g9303.t1.cds n=1 Tax=Oikopleura dioica TaxID=34765 RepID=A0ABN7RK19_OIKDI|nr:Oidioi.mRNA.OKI2018_I69.PAR.g9303.t1.cds [Oikopleura dioica]